MRQKEKNVSQNINNDSYVANKITEVLLDLLKKNDLNKIVHDVTKQVLEEHHFIETLIAKKMF